MIDKFRGKNFFLSNFYDGGRNTLEHRYQASKTFDRVWKDLILDAPTPGDARFVGRHRLPAELIHPNWMEIRVSVMQDLIARKFPFDFTAAGSLSLKLLLTGNEELIEGNQHHDNFWGTCLCKKCEDISGLNWLGNILMQRRSQLLAYATVNNFLRPQIVWKCPKRDYQFVGGLLKSELCPNHEIQLVREDGPSILDEMMKGEGLK